MNNSEFNKEEENLKLLINDIMKYNIISEMLNKGYIPIIYNNNYGGHGLSKKAKLLFKLIYKEFKEFKEYDESTKDKFINAFIKAKIIFYLGREASGPNASLVFDFVKIEMYSSIHIEEYDGMESVWIDENKYFTKVTKSILKDDTINNDQKILKINNMFNTEIEDSILTLEEAKLIC